MTNDPHYSEHGRAALDDNSQSGPIGVRRPWRNHLSKAAWAVVAAADVAVCVRLIGLAKYSGDDSWFPMGRALDFLHGGSSGLLYQSLFFTEHVRFQYPPSGLLLIDLARSIGISTYAQLNAINAGLLIIFGLVFAIFSVQTLRPIRCFGFQVPIGPLAFLIAIRFYPNNSAFQFGQIQLLLGFLFLLACFALLHEKRALAGCLVAAAATIKPQFMLFGLLTLWQRDWRFLTGFVVVLGSALVLSVALYGWDNNLDYLNVLKFLSAHGEYHHLNQSINGILVRFLYVGPSLDLDPSHLIPMPFPPYIPTVYFAATLSGLAITAIPFAVKAREPKSSISNVLGFCAAGALFTMASPIAWVHHYNILLPTYVVVLRLILDHGRGWIALSALGISFILTGLPIVPPFSPTIPASNLLQSHVFFGACILVGLAFVEMLTDPTPRRWETKRASA
jgi:Glycosyltransferase family 87